MASFIKIVVIVKIIIISSLNLLQLTPFSKGQSEPIIHRVWYSLRPPSHPVVGSATVPPIYNNVGDHGAETVMGDAHTHHVLPTQAHLVNNESSIIQTLSSRKTLVYGSPICIGRCIILQVFWSNSTSSLFGRKLPQPPTFPRPREVNRRQPNIS